MAAPALFQALSTYAESRHWLYIYPVWSRRAQGLSLGINLHPNHCCNWHCIYCQVPGLQRGPSPVIDIKQLQTELQDCLQWLDIACAQQPCTLQDVVQDIAFAGDGEPTTSPQFAEVLAWLLASLQARAHTQRPRTVRLITNGSQLHQAPIQTALRLLGQAGGEVWFKVDAGNDTEMRDVNDAHLPLSLHVQRLKACAAICPTWVQTAVMTRMTPEGLHTSPTLPAYAELLAPLKNELQGILLYGIARPSQQDTQGSIQTTPVETMNEYAQTLRTQGFSVRMFE